mmetsp:Transcript_4736/g.10736  ORF Transcript_4736/g.10736 Transcript_4736/m.10736 type:complete len:683 (+) Transcript_4736:123-2171(+)
MSMSLPLLGEVMPRPAKRTLRSSFAAAFSSGASARKLLPAFGTSSSSARGKTKRRSISRTIQAPLKNVSTRSVKVNSKVKRGKTSVQPKQKQGPSSPFRHFDSSDSPSETSHSSSHSAADTSKEHFCVEAGKLEIDASFTEFLKYFRSVDSGKPNLCPQFNQDTVDVPHTAFTKEMEDFSLHKALSPGIVPLGNTQEAATAFEAPAHVGDEEVCSRGDGHHRSNSCHIIPSICEGSAELCDRRSADDDIIVPQAASNPENAADSALAWGCLTALLGSPAPKSVLLTEKKQKKRTAVNLWQDDEAIDEDLDDIMFPQEDDEFVCDLQALRLDDEEGLTDAKDDCSIPSVSSEALLEDLILTMDDSMDLAFSTTPTTAKSNKAVADSTLAWSVLTAILGSPAPSSVVKRSVEKKRLNLWEDGEESDTLPEIYEQDDNEDDVLSLPSIDLNELLDADEAANDFVETEQVESKKESAESVLAWGALGMLLGSPALKLVSKKNRKVSRDAVKNLWDDGESNGNDALDTIPSMHPDEDNNATSILSPGGSSTAQKWFEQDASDDDDTHSIPSLSRTTSLSETSDDEDEYPSTPSMMSFDDLMSSPKRESSGKGLADSVLAWSALAAFMGSPAPKAVMSKRKKEAKFLWGEESDAIGCIPADLNLTLQDNQANGLSVCSFNEDDDFPFI